MADNDRVVVGCTHGEDDPDRVAVSYLTAGAALDQGREVVLWLSSEGVRLALQGYADRIRVDRDPPVERLHGQFIDNGGRFFVCPICFNERELDDGDLVENAELKGASPLMEFARPGTVTFTTRRGAPRPSRPRKAAYGVAKYGSSTDVAKRPRPYARSVEFSRVREREDECNGTRSDDSPVARGGCRRHRAPRAA